MLKGKTLVKITGMESGSQEIIFECSDGTAYSMFHSQDCCEEVFLEDICGNVEIIIGQPLLVAEKSTNSNEEPDYCYGDEYFEWTFYHLATINGYVDLRWYGGSNGYYAVDVCLIQIR